MGADITYTCLSAKKYKFKVTFYRDCRGVPFSNPSSQTKLVCIKNGSSQGVSLTRKSISDVTPICNTAISPCKPANQRSSEGIEAHVYEATIDFTKTPYSNLLKNGCCEIRLETAQCCRNSAITTGAANQNFYTYAMVNVCLGAVNNSPQLERPPIALLCGNQPTRLAMGGTDHLDYDSISYKFAQPMRGWNNKILYNSTHAYNNPFTVYYPGTLKFPYNNPNANPPIGINLNSETGQLTFTPLKFSESTVAVIEMEEWRKDTAGKYQKIGVIRRDMQFWVKQCPSNNPPTITTSSKKVTLHPCQETTCFTIQSADKVVIPPPPAKPGPKDTLTFIPPTLPEGFSFTVLDPDSAQPRAEICIDHNKVDITKLPNHPITLVIEIRDDACPINSVTQQAIKINFDRSSATGKITGQIINDTNSNCVKDTLETNLAFRRKLVLDTIGFTYIYTRDDGSFSTCLDSGQRVVSLIPNPWFEDKCTKDTVYVQKDSTIDINLYSKLKNGIAGFVFSDEGSCNIDSNSKPMRGQHVVATPGNHRAVTDVNGFYLLDVPKGNYTIKLDYDTNYFSNRCTKSFSVNYAGGNTTFADTFVQYKKIVQDLRVNIGFNTGTRVRRGNNTNCYLLLTNVGEGTIDSAVIIVQTDTNIVDLTNSHSKWKSLGNGKYSIKVYNLIEGKKYFYVMRFKTSDSKYTVGKIVKAVAETETNYTWDKRAYNDKDSAQVKIVAPYDPNIKTATPDSIFTTTDRTLVYNVQFQNEGSASAIDVVVRDTLPENLDLSTLEFHHASHDYRYVLEGRRLWIFFEGINLPAKKNDPTGSIGSVTFSIALKDTIFEETMVKNRVGIYFDLEDVVLTNYQTNHFKSPIEFLDTNAKVFCRDDTVRLPFKTHFTPEANNKFIVEITDSSGDFKTFATLGEVVSAQTEDSLIVALPPHLPNGDKYQIRIRSTAPVTTCFEEIYLDNFIIERLENTTLATVDNPSCHGESVLITASESLTTNDVYVNNILHSTGSTATVSSDTFKHGDEVFIVHTSDLGCTSYSDTMMLVVHAKPQIDLVMDSVFCLNETSAQFGHTLSHTAGDGTSDSLEWTFGDGSTIKTDASAFSPGHTYTSNGSYLAKVRAVNQGCIDSASLNVVWGHKPNAQFSLSRTSICQGDELHLYHTSTTTLGHIASVNWDFDNGGSSTDSATTHQFTNNGQHTIELIVTDNYGCQDTTTNLLDVTEAPMATIMSSALKKCINDAKIDFTSSVTGTYQSLNWDISGTPYSTPNATHQFTTVGNHSIQLVALSASSCHDTATAWVEIVDLENAQFTAPDEVCSDDQLNISSGSSNPTSTYTWTFDGSSDVGSTFTRDLTGVTVGSQTLQLVVENEHGCLDTLEQSLIITPKPTVSAVTSDVCEPDEVVLNPIDVANSTDSTRLNIVWETGVETGFLPLVANASHVYGAGVHNIDLIAQTGICFDTLRLPVEVFAKPLAALDVEAISGEPFIFTINNLSTNGNTHTWTIIGANSFENNDVSFTHDFGRPGSYLIHLMVESANGCKDETSFEHRVNGNITFYIPNAFSPNNDGVNDDFGLEPKEFVNEIDFKLFNRWGNLVEQSTDIDNLITSDLMPGLYMYTIDIIDFNGKKQYYYGTVNVW
jgi:gliding motility-associated-like protein/uncharacterized repeat protein (TIGR01451 family)